MDRFTKNFITACIVYLLVLATVIVPFKTVWMLSLVPSGSMEGTISTGDIVIATRYGIEANKLERYDILIFTSPGKADTQYIKRLIGLPGETIEIRDGKVYADGAELDSSFIRQPMNRKGDGIYQVPEGHYFFLGDNRNNSRDSRFWKEKYVPLENIKAKACLRILPFDHIGKLKYREGEGKKGDEIIAPQTSTIHECNESSGEKGASCIRDRRNAVYLNRETVCK